MPRCGCASDTCACYIVQGPNVTVTGGGSKDNPYVVSAATTIINPDGSPSSESTDHHFTGEIIEYAGDSAPTADYTLCDGKALSRTVYAQLFGRIGTVHGAGDGSTTFNVPNYSNRVGIGTSGTRARGTTGGTETTVLTQAMLPAHTHGMNHDHPAFTTASGGDHAHTFAQTRSNTDGAINTVKRDASNTDSVAIPNSGAHTHSIDVPSFTGTTGGGPGNSTPVPIMQSFIAMPRYIRIQGGP